MSDPPGGHVVSLRGAPAAGVAPRAWMVVGTLAGLLVTGVLVAGFVAALHTNARIERMKLHGVPVAVTVASCTGNLGGSGSNIAGYTCEGTYRLDDVAYHEVVGSLTRLVTAGTVVRGVVDPAQHSRVELASAVTSSSSSWTQPALWAGLLALLLVIAAFVLRWSRREGVGARRSTLRE